MSLLGRGGMGEVYRADDLKLGQAVALKFLPEAFERERGRLEQLLGEVRTARQVSHPNVCRVWDVGEAVGRHFIAMEYVDGEDLASLLRRIGRLPREKAVQIARQLCAGLGAVHEQEILHRDLKPSNVMLDGRGRVRITDFGVAGLAEEFATGGAQAGTPAYMAPEQLEGKEVTARSDVYALGLVLYELFTGRRAFDAQSGEEVRRLHRESTPTSPSTHVEGLDPTVERAILRCLEKEPRDRPASTLAVAAALPGGDALAAALAAGETPSPEIVAAAGGSGALRPGGALALLLIVVVGKIATVPWTEQLLPSGGVRLEKPPEVLAAEAQEVIRKAGFQDRPKDTAYWFTPDVDYFEWIDSENSRPAHARHPTAVQLPPIHFWFRQSPEPLVTSNHVVMRDDPPPIEPGMASVALTPDGQLLYYRLVPPQRDNSTPSDREPDWASLFERAGLDPASFRTAPPSWNPLLDCDRRAAWLGHYRAQPEVEVRVEAGAYRGTPVYFEVIPPWRKGRRTVEMGGSEWLSAFLAPTYDMIVTLAIWIVCAPLALVNLRRGRGDRRGALRFALFAFLAVVLGFILMGHHVWSPHEAFGLVKTMAWGLEIAALLWIAYVAVEPFVRRFWPETLISWSRLLAGRLRDPRIGRDILVGGAYDLATTLTTHASIVLLPWWLGRPASLPLTPYQVLVSLSGPRQAAGVFLFNILLAAYSAVYFLFAILVLRLVVRRMWVAYVAFVLLFALIFSTLTASNAFGLLTMLFGTAITLFVLVRFGLLAVSIGGVFAQVTFMLTLDPSSWFFGRSLMALLAVSALAVYGFYASVGGRSWFKSVLENPGR